VLKHSGGLKCLVMRQRFVHFGLAKKVPTEDFQLSCTWLSTVCVSFVVVKQSVNECSWNGFQPQ